MKSKYSTMHKCIPNQSRALRRHMAKCGEGFPRTDWGRMIWAPTPPSSNPGEIADHSERFSKSSSHQTKNKMTKPTTSLWNPENLNFLVLWDPKWSNVLNCIEIYQYIVNAKFLVFWAVSNRSMPSCCFPSNISCQQGTVVSCAPLHQSKWNIVSELRRRGSWTKKFKLLIRYICVFLPKYISKTDS